MPRNGARTRNRLLDAAQTLILDQGFAGTSVEAIIERAGVTKGAFFHHFPSKADLARAVMERYAAQDADHLEAMMARAERLSRDPLQQLLIFVGLLEESMEAVARTGPGCVFAAYIYEMQLFDVETLDLIRGAVVRWRERLGAKVREVAERYPPRLEVELDAVTDMAWILAEGSMVLARATGEREVLAAQVRQYRNYLELLFGAA